jgi:hypothetical protein
MKLMNAENMSQVGVFRILDPLTNVTIGVVLAHSMDEAKTKAIKSYPELAAIGIAVTEFEFDENNFCEYSE